MLLRCHCEVGKLEDTIKKGMNGFITTPSTTSRLKPQSFEMPLVKELYNFFQSLFNVENHFVIRSLHKVKKHKIDKKAQK